MNSIENTLGSLRDSGLINDQLLKIAADNHEAINSMFDPWNILIGVLASVLGVMYIKISKVNSEMSYMLSGVALLVFPFFILDPIKLAAISILLAAAPFVIKKMN